jgi:transposase InsO family protein
MPWKASSVVDERWRFVRACLAGERTMKALCEVHGISRKTGYKWLESFKLEGRRGLVDRSRARKTQESAIAEAIADALVCQRLKRPTWGPRKIVAALADARPKTRWPAPSTVGEILKRKGLVAKRRRAQQPSPRYPLPLLQSKQPNDIWCADFKGEFGMGDGKRCYPLTISDHFSRFLLECKGLLSPSTEMVQPIFERAFREFGLPLAIRSDNGAPFASPAGLSRLSVWWVKLGIRPERIEPGNPQQNGRHERMHRTLKREAPPAADLRAQQRTFDGFRHLYNHERPHEALGQKPPARLYLPSSRELPSRLPELEYPAHLDVRRINSCGSIGFNRRQFYVGTALAGERVGFEPIDNGIWRLHFSFLVLGHIDERLRDTRLITPRHEGRRVLPM